jgi:hypothetical protein
MQPPPPAYNPDSGQKPPVAQAVQAMPVQAQPVIVGVPGMIALPPANSVQIFLRAQLRDPLAPTDSPERFDAVRKFRRGRISPKGRILMPFILSPSSFSLQGQGGSHYSM